MIAPLWPPFTWFRGPNGLRRQRSERARSRSPGIKPPAVFSREGGTDLSPLDPFPLVPVERLPPQPRRPNP